MQNVSPAQSGTIAVSLNILEYFSWIGCDQDGVRHLSREGHGFLLHWPMQRFIQIQTESDLSRTLSHWRDQRERKANSQYVHLFLANVEIFSSHVWIKQCGNSITDFFAVKSNCYYHFRELREYENSEIIKLTSDQRIKVRESEVSIRDNAGWSVSLELKFGYKPIDRTCCKNIWISQNWDRRVKERVWCIAF